MLKYINETKAKDNKIVNTLWCLNVAIKLNKSQTTESLANEKRKNYYNCGNI